MMRNLFKHTTNMPNLFQNVFFDQIQTNENICADSLIDPIRDVSGDITEEILNDFCETFSPQEENYDISSDTCLKKMKDLVV